LAVVGSQLSNNEKMALHTPQRSRTNREANPNSRRHQLPFQNFGMLAFAILMIIGFKLAVVELQLSNNKKTALRTP
jgi:hypothetical protein